MSKEQTAVEFLYGEMASILNYGVDPVTALKIFDIYKQAKEMEREQIIDSFAEGHARFSECGEFELEVKSEQYYTQTYGE